MTCYTIFFTEREKRKVLPWYRRCCLLINIGIFISLIFAGIILGMVVLRNSTAVLPKGLLM